MSLGLDVSDLPPGVVYRTRDEWGLTIDEARRRGLTVQPRNLAQCFVHHTAGQAPDQSTPVWDDDPLAFVAWLDSYARNSKGYKALDYSVIVHQAPGGRVTIVEGRAEFYPAATLDSNTTSKAICYAGNYDSRYGNNPRREPSTRELDAGRWLVTAMRRAGVLAPDVTVYGHRDNPKHPNATACPGDWLYAHVAYIATPWPTTKPAPLEEDAMKLIQVADDDAVLVATGHLVGWVHGDDAGDAIQDAVRLGLVDAQPVQVPRSFLALLTLVGPVPVYGPWSVKPGRTKLTDFSTQIS